MDETKVKKPKAEAPKNEKQAKNENAKAAEPSKEIENDGVYLSMEDFEDLKKRVDAIKLEKDEMTGLAQRVQADFDNYRKRNASIRQDSLKEGSRDVIEALIPVIDNFDRAISASKEANMDEKWLSGFEMVHRQLYETLAKLGFEEIEALDEEFDPNVHDAVMCEPVEGVEEGKVVEVLQKGYKVGDKLIRASMVKISG